MTHSDQGITKTERGEEQPADKDRAQTAHQSDPAKSSPSQQETRKGGNDAAARSGHSGKNG